MFNSRQIGRVFLFAALLAGFAVSAAVASAKPLAKPADIEVAVSPGAVSPGERTAVTVRIDPIDGVDINRYPRIKLKVPAQERLVAAGEASVGNDGPPRPGQKELNYFDAVAPVELELQVDPGAEPGKHAVDGKLTYYYCVKASGFCAPHRTTIAIPVEIK